MYVYYVRRRLAKHIDIWKYVCIRNLVIFMKNTTYVGIVIFCKIMDLALI
jgi:hypothetical protein